MSTWFSKKFGGRPAQTDLLTGSVSKGLIRFAVPLLLGQFLQQMYNLADAWVIGRFASNDEFAAVSSAGSVVFFVIGFVSGLAIGGGVIISKYFGAGDDEMVEKSIHTNFLLAIIASVIATVVGTVFAPQVVELMDTPAEVLPYSVAYFRIIFAGVSANVIYNFGMSIMRSLGDSLHPLYYLIVSSIMNVILDLLFVAGFGMGVEGAAVATVLTQALSAVLCLARMMRLEGYQKLCIRKLKWNGPLMGEVLIQGLPTGIQNSVISIGNMTVQSKINFFGSAAMSGVGAYYRIEGFAFLPINCMSMSIPTFIGQNLGAKKYDRAKKGARFGILSGVVMAELVGVAVFFGIRFLLKFFIDDPASIEYGITHASRVTLFYFLLAFSHCAAGVMRGCGKSVIPMAAMLSFWCVFRVFYVNIALKYFPVLQTVSWVYPITWAGTTIVFTCFLLFSDWTHSFEKKKFRATGRDGRQNK